MFEPALLDEVHERGEEGEQKRGIGGEQEGNVEEDPAGVEQGKGCGLLAGTEGGYDAEEEADGQDEDADGDGSVAPIDQKEGQTKEEAEESLSLVGVDWERVVGCVEHLGQGDEVEEYGGNGGWNGDVTPARAIVEGGGQDRERGNAVEEDSDSEPEERHTIGFAKHEGARISSISGWKEAGTRLRDLRAGLLRSPEAMGMAAETAIPIAGEEIIAPLAAPSGGLRCLSGPSGADHSSDRSTPSGSRSCATRGVEGSGRSAGFGWPQPRRWRA